MRKILLILLASACSLMAYAQDRTVTGTVTSSEDGSTLPGVNVLVKGTTTGTITDFNGAYSLNTSDDAVLIFSFVGYSAQEISVSNRSIIDVTLSPDVKQLSEVVVTAFGVEREKKALGYSVQEVGNEEINKTKPTSVLNSLQGKIAGAQINSAGGAPGASTNVILRGPTSLLGNNQALFVVDGVPINNSTSDNVQSSGNFFDNVVDGGNRANDINPNDIESVTVLKGPSAAALYGSRAANGVILITTKKGSNTQGKMNINFNTSYTLSDVLVVPKMQNRFGQGQFGDTGGYLNDQESWGKLMDGQLQPYGAIVNNKQRYKNYSARPDNVKDFFETGKLWQNSLSLSGGGDRGTYYLSISDLQQTGVMKNSDYHRNNITVNTQAKISEKLSSSASINYSRIKGNLMQTGQRNQAIGQIVSMPRDFSIVDMEDLSNPYNTPDGFFTPFIVNPYYSLEHDYSKQELNRVYGNIQLVYNPLDWITATARLGTDVMSDQRNTFADIVEYAPGSPNAGAAFNTDGEYSEQKINRSEINADLMVSMQKNITEDFSGTLLVGYNFNQRSTTNLSSTANALTIPGFANLSNASGNTTSVGTSSLRRLMGVYSSLDLNYKGYLFLGATFRNDWSSTLPIDNNSFSYPGVNVGFVLTDAFDLGISNTLSFLKLRASYAEVGNDANVYLTKSVFAQSGFTNSFANINFPFNDGNVTVPGFSESNTIGNAALQPEITKSVELGADFRLFNGRLNLDATYYDATSESQILSALIAPSTGFTNQVLNVGKINNKGVELQLSGTPIKTNNFTWNISLNYSKNKNVVKELNDGNTELTLLNQGLTPGLKIRLGEPYGVFEATTTKRNEAGQIIVNRATGIPEDADAPVYVGSIQPDWLGGLTSDMTYKNFRLSVTLDTRQGGNVVSSTAAQLYFAGIAEETAFNDREEWVVPNSVIENDDGSFTPNNIPLTMYGGNVRNYWSNIQGGNRNDEVLLDASYIKLREVSLSYNFPTSLLEKTPLGSASISFIGRNLWLHTGADNHFIDPEASAFGTSNTQGYEFIGIPSQASYGFNIKVSF